MPYQIVPCEVKAPLWPQVVTHSPRAARWMASCMAPDHYQCLAAVGPDRTFLGLCIIEIGPLHFGPLADVTVGFLEDLLVLEPHRRQGIGTALLRATLDAAWRRGAEHVRWTVRYDSPAIPFYRTLGVAFIPDEDAEAEHPQRCYTVVAVNPALLAVCSRRAAEKNATERSP